MKLHGMAEAFRAQLETTEMSQLAFEERFGLLVDQQWLWKENRALAHRLRSARLKERGVMEDIDYQHPRGLGRKLMRTLANSEWVRQHQNILLIGRPILRHSAPPCYIVENTDPPPLQFGPTDGRFLEFPSQPFKHWQLAPSNPHSDTAALLHGSDLSQDFFRTY